MLQTRNSGDTFGEIVELARAEIWSSRGIIIIFFKNGWNFMKNIKFLNTNKVLNFLIDLLVQHSSK